MTATRTATCFKDDLPLVLTFAFRGYEFICMGCGRLYTYFGPKPADSTPELLEQSEKLKAEWQELAMGIVPSGAYRDDCAACKTAGPHMGHATDEEIAAHDAAMARIGERFPALRRA